MALRRRETGFWPAASFYCSLCIWQKFSHSSHQWCLHYCKSRICWCAVELSPISDENLVISSQWKPFKSWQFFIRLFHTGRVSWISAAIDRNPKFTNLMPKRNLLALVNHKIRIKSEFSSDTLWCYPLPICILFCILTLFLDSSSLHLKPYQKSTYRIGKNKTIPNSYLLLLN
jgi:hypothetical protein